MTTFAHSHARRTLADAELDPFQFCNVRLILPPE